VGGTEWWTSCWRVPTMKAIRVFFSDFRLKVSAYNTSLRLHVIVHISIEAVTTVHFRSFMGTSLPKPPDSLRSG
jgi:hypothetical protein